MSKKLSKKKLKKLLLEQAIEMADMEEYISGLEKDIDVYSEVLIGFAKSEITIESKSDV